MTKRVPLIAVLAACLCAPSPAAAQEKDAHRLNSEQAARRSLGPHCVPALAGEAALDKDAYRLSSEQAARTAVNVERTIKSEEPKWRLKESRPLGHVVTQLWRSSGGGELSLAIYVCDSLEGASRKLFQSGSFAIAGSDELEGFGEEARYIDIPYFTWVGVRKGRLVAVVQGPGRAMTTTKRFARYALEQLEAQ
jgi:hypothetical protein